MAARLADTNLLLYAISTDPGETLKRQAALAILEDRELLLCTQVLQEFYVQATRASRSDRLSHDQAAGLVESFMRFRVQETTRALVLAAMVTGNRYGISYWDAAVIEAARLSGCDVVLSEDLADGQDYGGVRVENPFRSA